ncbi:MAG: lasso peptide biosynthesis B2 protein [Verrucomicrobiota bacterium]
MNFRHSLQRFFAVDAARKRLVLEALVILTWARVVVWIVPFRQVAKMLSSSKASEPIGSPAEANNIGWAIRVVSNRVPGFHCLVQGLAATRMLHRRGLPASTHFGVRKDPETAAIGAHAWVICDGEVITGERNRSNFEPIATFGDKSK